MERLISINNSSESFEKSIGIMYTNIKSNPLFYEKYDIQIFYGDNLPKTNNKLIVTGTIGFYDKYMSDFNFSSSFNINELWSNRINVLNGLVEKNIISTRNADKLSNDYEMFSKVISKMPVSYIYPNFYSDLLEKIKLIIPNVSFQHLDLFKTYEKILNEISEYYELYKIYGLQLNGDISVFNFVLPQNEFFEKSKIHLLRSISKSIALSGNTAILLSQIKDNIEKGDFVGYRNHKYNRFSRQVALDRIINTCPNTLIEPKNYLYNNYFDKYKDVISNEERANEVAADAFHDFVKENVKSLKI